MTALWIAAALCVATMGFAIQRGGTCTVAAVDELLNQRRAHRLLAMLEASLWVAGGLALAQWLQVAGSMPAGHAASRWTIAGGALLGLGAWLNRACVFGAIARLGSGEWAYAFTPLGFYVGCLSVAPVFAQPQALTQATPSPLFGASALLAPLFVCYAAGRVLLPVLTARRTGGAGPWREKVWSPHAATIIIGISFVLTLLLAGPWAYTDLLADLAGGMAASLGGRVLLFTALLAGAMWGGWTAGRWRSGAASLAQSLRCFAGGLLMGWGSLLIPGSNDGLVLIGIPLLRPYAWLAFATMCLAIALAIASAKAWQAWRARVPVAAS
jgi:toxin CptA